MLNVDNEHFWTLFESIEPFEHFESLNTGLPVVDVTTERII